MRRRLEEEAALRSRQKSQPPYQLDPRYLKSTLKEELDQMTANTIEVLKPDGKYITDVLADEI